jgi:hypothetical protein
VLDDDGRPCPHKRTPHAMAPSGSDWPHLLETPPDADPIRALRLHQVREREEGRNDCVTK